MKLIHLSIATAVAAFASGAAYAQQAQPPAAPTPGSVTGDWNGAHAPTDDKQYQDKVRVPLGTPAPASATEAAPPAEPSTVSATSTTSTDTAAPTGTASAASFTSMTVTNGPVPDTKENRAKYGQPMSRAGKRTAAAGN
jgi:hypothetical protein